MGSRPSIRNQVFKATRELQAQDPENPLSQAFTQEGIIPTEPGPVATAAPVTTPDAPAPDGGAVPPQQIVNTTETSPPGHSPSAEGAPTLVAGVDAQPPAAPEAPGAPTPVEPPVQLGGQAAAEPPVVQPSVQPDGYEAVTYRDPELDRDVEVYVRPEDKALVRDAYAMKAAMQRHATYLGRYKDRLEPLITSGEMENYLPIIEAVRQDPQLNQLLGDVIYRYLSGDQTLIPAVQNRQAPQAAPAPQPAPQVDSNSYLIDPEEYDPVLADATTKAVRTGLAPLQEQMQTIQQQIDAQRQAAERMEQQRQQAYIQQQAANQFINTVARELQTRFPGDFTGVLAQDQDKLARLFTYMNSGNYWQLYGQTPATAIMAYTDLQSKAALARQQAQPTSQLAQLEAQARANGAALAQQVGGRVVNGTPSPPPAPPPQVDPMAAIATRKGDGKPRNIRDVSRDVVKVLEGR